MVAHVALFHHLGSVGDSGDSRLPAAGPISGKYGRALTGCNVIKNRLFVVVRRVAFHY